MSDSSMKMVTATQDGFYGDIYRYEGQRFSVPKSANASWWEEDVAAAKEILKKKNKAPVLKIKKLPDEQ